MVPPTHHQRHQHHQHQYQHQRHAESNRSAAAEEARRQLPDVPVDVTTLGLLCGRVARRLFSELTTLAETMPSLAREPAARRKGLMDHALFARQRLTRLLVVVKWARDNSADFQACQNIIALLSSQNDHYRQAVDGLFGIHSQLLPHMRQRNYDVVTALDVLSSGNYSRMPASLYLQFNPQKLNPSSALETLGAVDNILRVSIMCSTEIPNSFRKYISIQNGRLILRVNGEFEVILIPANVNLDI
ncbi:mediator complex, subunit MED14, partial [Ramicandelaber brevisporus]